MKPSEHCAAKSLRWQQSYTCDSHHALLHRLFAFRALQQQRDRLMLSVGGGDHQWIMDLDQQFVSRLDQIAQRRIKRYALQVAIKTAAAPTGFLDAAIALVNGYLLLGDLCQIYNVRTGRWSTIRLLLHVGFNMVAANRLDEFSEAAFDGLFAGLYEEMGGLVAGALRIVCTRAAEGTANGLLLARFGLMAIQLLRPIARNAGPAA